jgi:hypothetical protein
MAGKPGASRSVQIEVPAKNGRYLAGLSRLFLQKAARRMPMPEQMEITLTALSEKYDADDDRWRGQVGELVHQLRTETDAVRLERTPVPGTKGAIDELIISLGSAGVFTAVEQVFRSWLARDKTRSIQLSYKDGKGHVQKLQVAASNATEDVFAPVLNAVAHQIESP